MYTSVPATELANVSDGGKNGKTGARGLDSLYHSVPAVPSFPLGGDWPAHLPHMTR